MAAVARCLNMGILFYQSQMTPQFILNQCQEGGKKPANTATPKKARYLIIHICRKVEKGPARVVQW